MRNYTTQTAALKATTIDTRLLDAKRIDTQKLFVNGVSIDELGGSDDNYKIIKTTFKKKDVWVGNWGDGRLAVQFEPYSPVTGEYCEGRGFYPFELYINGHPVTCAKDCYAGGWCFFIADVSDDLSEIYGGITDETEMTIFWQEQKEYNNFN